MKINLMNIKQRKLNLKIFTMISVLESKFEVNAIGINRVKNLLIWKNKKL